MNSEETPTAVVPGEQTNTPSQPAPTTSENAAGVTTALADSNVASDSSASFGCFGGGLSSKSSKTKSAVRVLCVGIEYGKELVGCARDAQNFMKAVMRANPNIPSSSRRLMLDSAGVSVAKRDRPNRANILAAFDWLLKGATSGSKLFFFYSGHGTYRKSSGDAGEADGRDEAIVPTDYVPLTCIYDNELRSRLVQRVPKGALLTCVFDCCNSGTTLDLRYNLRDVDPLSPVREEKRYSRSKGEVVYLGACKDDELAYVGSNDENKAQGVLTIALLRALDKAWSTGKSPTYRELHRSVYADVVNYDQHVQLSIGRDSATADLPVAFA